MKNSLFLAMKFKTAGIFKGELFSRSTHFCKFYEEYCPLKRLLRTEIA